jgi:uracil-DNA glycosylase
MGVHRSCPGYVDEPFASLVAEYPGTEAYPANDFRVEWGPVFHRGRLDGSARLLVIGQDPATHEAISRRVLVGEAGQRVQGLLARLGITSSYVMLNVYLYSVFGQSAGYRHVKDPAIVDYRHRWLDAVLMESNVTAVLALGTLANRAFGVWKASSPERTDRAKQLHVAAVRHPTYAEGSARASGQALEDTTAAQLADWTAHLPGLGAAVAPEVTPNPKPYGEAWAENDLVAIPERDLPPGAPAWWRAVDSWAVREGVDAQEKRSTIRVTVPKGARSWPTL